MPKLHTYFQNIFNKDHVTKTSNGPNQKPLYLLALNEKIYLDRAS